MNYNIYISHLISSIKEGIRGMNWVLIIEDIFVIKNNTTKGKSTHQKKRKDRS